MSPTQKVYTVFLLLPNFLHVFSFLNLHTLKTNYNMKIEHSECAGQVNPPNNGLIVVSMIVKIAGKFFLLLYCILHSYCLFHSM
jgi:hypothetical protein